ncbi:TolC family protein [Ideonella oryzae]|uniref:Protein CyaE n=1 Tax=Ideonella oryzae TaxID=2937441 RepID=A0ABT1BRC5_9BURK|nr:TolC family protein [Ideonella oryzae]MCO5978735.1 TolC family protein [Ideonella oryzae]
MSLATSLFASLNTAMAAPQTTPAWPADHEYTLPELVDLALQENPGTRMAQAGTRNAALGQDMAAASYLPRLNATIAAGRQSFTNSQQAAGLDAHGGGSVTGTLSALSLHWLLYDFGQRDAVVASSQALSTAAQWGETGERLAITHEVCLAFYAFQAAQERLRTAQQALDNAQEIQLAAQARRQGGVGTVLELAQAQQATAQARLARVRAQGALQDAEAALTNAIGLPPAHGPRIASLSPQPLGPDTLPTVDALIDEALSRRADVAAAHATLQASQHAVEAAEADYRPKVFLSATGAYASGDLGVSAIPGIGQQLPTLNVQGQRWSSTVLLGLSIPLYDGQVRDNALQQARNNADRAEAGWQRSRLEAARQVVTARNALATSLAACDAAQTLLSTSQTFYDASLDAYRHGVGSLTATVAAQTQLAEARLAVAEAYYGARSAAANLAFATGQ